MDAAYQFAKFAYETQYEDLPESVVEIVKKDVLDTMGCWLGGGDSSVVKALIDLYAEAGGKPECTVLGHGLKLPAPQAGLINAARVVTVDFDDHHEPAHAHIGSTSIPTALAIAERVGGVTGKDMICAIAVGSEVACRLGKNTVKRHPDRVMGGWDYTFTLGVFSAAIVAAKLLGLDAEGIHNALGIAYHQTSGTDLSAMEGADTKDLGSGFACQAAIVSALLAQKGVTGARSIFDEYPCSFAYQYNNGCDREALTRDLGSQWDVEFLGFKEYPSCTNTHRHADAVKKIMEENAVAPEEITKIVAHVSPMVFGMCEPPEVTKTPPDGISARFSIPWVIACMAQRRRVGINEFTEEGIRSRDLLDMAARVECICDETLADYASPAEIEIVTKRGSFRGRTKHELYGSFEDPMTWDSLVEKFRSCAETADPPLKAGAAEALLGLISSLEFQEDIVSLIRAVS